MTSVDKNLRRPAPRDAVLMSNVARRFYLAGESKTQIAEALGVNRFRVARLLELAVETGVVRIEVHTPDRMDADLSYQLQDLYGLKYVMVLDASADDEVELRTELGEASGQLLRAVVTAEDVVGLAWARSLHSIGAALPDFPAVPVVQLSGALSRPDGVDILELVRAVARRGGGEAHVFYAPMIAQDAATARTLTRQADVARVLKLASRVTVAVVGIGAWAPGLSTVHDAFGPADRRGLARAGAIADVSGIVIRADGSSVDTAATRRVIAFSAADLRAIPTVIAVAYGARKLPAVAAALEGKLIHGLVTHRELAQRLIDHKT